MAPTLDSTVEKSEWCPTMGGTFTAYEPQWRTPGGKWAVVPFEETSTRPGIPYPHFPGGLMQTIGMCAHNQAMALAYSYAAFNEAARVKIEVRVVPYTVVYDLKAKLLNPSDSEETVP